MPLPGLAKCQNAARCVGGAEFVDDGGAEWEEIYRKRLMFYGCGFSGGIIPNKLKNTSSVKQICKT